MCQCCGLVCICTQVLGAEMAFWLELDSQPKFTGDDKIFWNIYSFRVHLLLYFTSSGRGLLLILVTYGLDLTSQQLLKIHLFALCKAKWNTYLLLANKLQESGCFASLFSRLMETKEQVVSGSLLRWVGKSKGEQHSGIMTHHWPTLCRCPPHHPRPVQRSSCLK